MGVDALHVISTHVEGMTVQEGRPSTAQAPPLTAHAPRRAVQTTRRRVVKHPHLWRSSASPSASTITSAPTSRSRLPSRHTRGSMYNHVDDAVFGHQTAALVEVETALVGTPAAALLELRAQLIASLEQISLADFFASPEFSRAIVHHMVTHGELPTPRLEKKSGGKAPRRATDHATLLGVAKIVNNELELLYARPSQSPPPLSTARHAVSRSMRELLVQAERGQLPRSLTQELRAAGAIAVPPMTPRSCGSATPPPPDSPPPDSPTGPEPPPTARRCRHRRRRRRRRGRPPPPFRMARPRCAARSQGRRRARRRRLAASGRLPTYAAPAPAGGCRAAALALAPARRRPRHLRRLRRRRRQTRDVRRQRRRRRRALLARDVVGHERRRLQPRRLDLRRRPRTRSAPASRVSPPAACGSRSLAANDGDDGAADVLRRPAKKLRKRRRRRRRRRRSRRWRRSCRR